LAANGLECPQYHNSADYTEYVVLKR